MGSLIDSNILVYSYSIDYEYLRPIIIDESSCISEISRLEVLGYHKINPAEEDYFQDIFSLAPIIFPSQVIFDSAIAIRKKYNLKLGDSLIAATAIVNELTLYTRNTDDFEKVKELKCINPVL